MSEILQSLWQTNIEISLLLLLVFILRYLIRKTTRIYNAYLLWLSIPAGLLIAKIISQLRISPPPVESVNYLVQSYVIQPANSFEPWFYAGLAWATVACLLLLRLFSQHRKLRMDLARIRFGNKLDFHSKYPIIAIDKDDFSPAVYGFFKPKIYFPIQLCRELSQAQIELIIRHEEHHIKQQHLWLNLLWDVLVCCMWFNPLVYISRQNFRHDQELFCDYLVLNTSTKQDHKTYGHALLSTVSATHSVSLLCSWKSFNQLEERIMNIKKSTSLSSKISLVVGSLAIVGCTSFYSVNAAQHTASESFHHEVEDDGSSEITWIVDGKTYQEENGMRYIVEGNDKRAMNRTEHKEFERAVARSKVELAASERELRRAEIEIERARRDMDRHVIELERQEHELGKQELEIDRYEAEMEKAAAEIEQALHEIEISYEAGEIPEQEMTYIRDNLAKTRQGLIRDRKNLQRDTRRARADMQRAKAHIKRAQTDLKMPKPPKKVVAPKNAEAPVPPSPPVVDTPDPVEATTKPGTTDPASAKNSRSATDLRDIGVAH